MFNFHGNDNGGVSVKATVMVSRVGAEVVVAMTAAGVKTVDNKFWRVEVKVAVARHGLNMGYTFLSS